LNGGVLITFAVELILLVAGTLTGSVPSPERVEYGNLSAVVWLATLYMLGGVIFSTNGCC